MHLFPMYEEIFFTSSALVMGKELMLGQGSDEAIPQNDTTWIESYYSVAPLPQL